MRLLIMPGDGIGPEITAAAMAVTEAASRRFGLALSYDYEEVGFASLEKHGTTLRQEVFERARTYDGIVLGTQSHADYPPPDQGGRNISAAFRVGDTAGYRDGYADGYKNQYKKSFRIGEIVGGSRAYRAGSQAEYRRGYAAGYRSGYERGWTVGKRAGRKDGFNDGYQQGAGQRNKLRNEMRECMRRGTC